MASIFVSLPAPASNGPGAAVNMSAFGAAKTVTVEGNGFTFEPYVSIEISCDAGGVRWAPLTQFRSPGEQTFDIACHWMRAVVANYKGGGAPVVNVGGYDDGTSFAALNVPTGNGTGTDTSTRTLGLFKTVQVGGPMRGAVNVLASEDGGATFQQVMSFSQPGAQSAQFAADFMRVSRVGVPQVNPGAPIVNVAANADIGAGSAGNPAAFSYTVTGLEPDLSNLTIPLPIPRSTSSYLVQVTSQAVAVQLVPSIPIKGTSAFTLRLSADATAGDVYAFYVTDAF